MNNAKIAAALHALADAFLEGGEDQPTKPAKSKGKTAAVEQPATPAIVETIATPVVPIVTKDQLNKLVLKVAAKSRDIAEAVLSKFGGGAKNTVTLAPEYWQPVYDALEEEIAKQDAAAVQVAQASLV